VRIPPEKARALFFVVSLAVFLGSLFIVYRGISTFREARLLEDILTRVDARLESGRYGDVNPLLDEASRVVSTPRNALRVLKRAYLFAEETGSDAPLRDRALEWHRRYTGSSDIAAVAVLAFLESEDSEGRRIEPADDFFDDYPYLGAAFLLKRGMASDRTEYPYLLLDLGKASTPGAFFAAAEASGRSEYAVDGVLQLASGGFLRDAQIQGELFGLSSVQPMLMATLAYDIGDWGRAADLLAPIPSNEAASLALRGDVMYLAGKSDTARRAYEALFLTGYPFGPVSYNNAALLYPEKEARVQLLRDGLLRYPGDAMLLAALIDYEGREAGEEQLSILAGRFSPSVGVAAEQPTSARDRLVYYLLTQADSRPPAANAAQLWSIANAYPQDATALRYLAWYLSELGRVEELGSLMNERGAEVSRSLVFYRALFHNSEGRPEAAFLDFRAAHEALFSWEAGHNAAVLAMELGRFSEALQLLDEAQGEPWYQLTDSRRGRLKVLEARVRLRQGDTEAARRSLREALALAPGDTTAILLIDALEDQ
jgi:predicted negative regulator of RcsB-dependent stress response